MPVKTCRSYAYHYCCILRCFFNAKQNNNNKTNKFNTLSKIFFVWCKEKKKEWLILIHKDGGPQFIVGHGVDHRGDSLAFNLVTC